MLFYKNCLLSYWPINLFDADMADLVGANIGKVKGNPSNKDYFNGDVYVEIPDSQKLFSQKGSICTWIKPSAGDYRTVLSKGYGNQDGGYALRITRDSEPIMLSFGIHNTNGEWISVGKYNNIKNDCWYCVVATWDDKKLSLYINGSLNDCKNFEGIIKTNTLPLRIGRLSTSCPNTEYYLGVIDGVWIWEKPLSSEEIVNFYYTQKK